MASADNALTFVSSGYCEVDFDSGSDIDNLSAFTWCAWVRPAGTNGNGGLASKASSSVGWDVKVVNGNISATFRRATTNAVVYDYNNHKLGTSGAWVFVAVVFDLSGGDTDQHIYYGNLATPAAETPSYYTQTVGSGSQSDDQYQTYTVGRVASTQAFSCRMAYPHLIAGALSLSEIQAIQYDINPVTGTKRLHELGAGGSAVATAASGYGSAGSLGGTTPPTWADGPGSPVTYLDTGTPTSPTVIDTPGSGTFTVPSGVTAIRISGWGSGGACLAGIGGGAGGGGAAWGTRTIAVTEGDAIDYTVPAGGDGGTSSDGADLLVYDNTDTLVLQIKGGDAPTVNSVGGAGGLASECLATTAYDGGDGAPYSDPDGGGGGGAAGTDGPGGDASGVTGGTGGTGGGDGGTYDATATGGTPGGGAGASFSGADGGDGQLTIEWGEGIDPPSGFQAAWARGANQFAGAGVTVA